MKNKPLKEQLLDDVLNQIADDCANGDVGAVYDLILNIPNKVLIEYLHEALRHKYLTLKDELNNLNQLNL
jgi:hypothetical protein